MSVAVRAIQEYGFTVVGLKRMVSTIDPNNTWSIRVAEKIDLHYEKDAFIEGYVDRVYVIEQQDQPDLSTSSP